MATETIESNDLICTLTDAEIKERRFQMREKLLPHVENWHLKGRNLTLVFPNQTVARVEVEHFVELEKQCCGFLSFTISAQETKLNLQVQGPEGSEEVLKQFAEAATGAVN